MYKRPELLSPAGDPERLRYAVCYGADAVYCGMQEFGMRSACANFDPAQLEEGCIYAHARGKRVYLTLNTLPTNEEMDRLPQTVRDAVVAGVDAFIVTDLGVLEAVQAVRPRHRDPPFHPDGHHQLRWRPGRPGTWGPSGWCWPGS